MSGASRELFSFLQKYENFRTARWPLMSLSYPTLYSVVPYLLAVTVIGPKLMHNRKPFQMRNVLILYNLFQLLVSTWLFYEFSAAGWLNGTYNYQCQPIDYSSKSFRMDSVTWWYYISKYTELIETILFIMRKKYNQVTVLHVFHHGIMPFSGFLAAKYYPNGHGTFPGFMNTFVHIIMYFYYLCSALGPKVQPYLWWKKYITSLQLAQFVIIWVHALQLLVTDCNFPKIFIVYMGLLSTIFYILFKQFYSKAYKNCKSEKKCVFNVCS